MNAVSFTSWAVMAIRPIPLRRLRNRPCKQTMPIILFGCLNMLLESFPMSVERAAEAWCHIHNNVNFFFNKLAVLYGIIVPTISYTKFAWRFIVVLKISWKDVLQRRTSSTAQLWASWFILGWQTVQKTRTKLKETDQCCACLPPSTLPLFFALFINQALAVH